MDGLAGRTGTQPWAGALSAEGAAGVRRLFRQCAAAGLVGLGERDALVRLLPDGLDALRAGARVALPSRGPRRIVREGPPRGIPGWRADLWADLRLLLDRAGEGAAGATATRLVAAAGDDAALAAACSGLAPALAAGVRSAAAARRPRASLPSAPAFDLF